MGTEDSDAPNPRAVQRRNFGTFRMVTMGGFLRRDAQLSLKGDKS